MKLHVELIFIWKVLHLDSFWNRGTRELGSGLFVRFPQHSPVPIYTPRPGLEPRLLAPESSALTMKPPSLPQFLRLLHVTVQKTSTKLCLVSISSVSMSVSRDLILSWHIEFKFRCSCFSSLIPICWPGSSIADSLNLNLISRSTFLQDCSHPGVAGLLIYLLKEQVNQAFSVRCSILLLSTKDNYGDVL